MARSDRLLREHLRLRFVVTMKSGATFDGLLLDHDPQTLELADAHAYGDSGKTPLDGRLYLPRAEVDYMQRPEAT